MGIILTYLFSWIFDLDKVLGNMPFFTLFNFEVYRVILSPIVGNSIMSVILIALFYPVMGRKMESSLGSTAFLLLIGTISLITNITFDLVCLVFYFGGMVDAMFWNCSGFWTVLFGLITIECMAAPEMPRRMMFIPVDIPSMYFPLVLYGFFSLFSGPQLDFAISMGVGYAYSKGHLDRFKPSSAYLDQQESSGGLLHSLSRQSGWVLAGLAQGHEAWLPVNNPDAQGGSGGGGGWGGGGGGFGGSTSTNTQAPSAKDSFPGSGRKLSAGDTFAMASVNTTASSAGFSSSREAVAARRLAALTGAQTPPPTMNYSNA